MTLHRTAWIVPSVVALVALAAGCQNQKETGSSSSPAASAAASAAPAGKLGSATLRGEVRFTGQPPEMKVPAKRVQATDVCKDKQLAHDAVVVQGGKLRDVLVRIAPKSFDGRYDVPPAATVDQVDCIYVPRIQGVLSGQEIVVKNSDRTLHNVHTYLGAETVFNEATAMGSPPIAKRLPPSGIVRFGCDIHPWMRSFVVVTDHPFFAVSGADGAFRIDRVPAGKYTLEAFHARYGVKTQEVTVTDGQTLEVAFSFDGTEPEPPENQGELQGLW
ncbi:carboxypeptidase regulatory-like domain-containing protein [Polyangium sp. 15x6]|uniref:carboxypeptidase regulatory-like domain-containing protein n=1 Tax=Polyangium sp. 15x6 TaxID=3042687 RepID=UPI00249A184A|nr:carboxypeptidase regulatory-like domain-containing protein [Polyangium sp. 15x6]MDI3283084.1 carboxypeptidase regulatory-like domain-containing protein [Polyangium sp. 15x6]